MGYDRNMRSCRLDHLYIAQVNVQKPAGSLPLPRFSLTSAVSCSFWSTNDSKRCRIKRFSPSDPGTLAVDVVICCAIFLRNALSWRCSRRRSPNSGCIFQKTFLIPGVFILSHVFKKKYLNRVCRMNRWSWYWSTCFPHVAKSNLPFTAPLAAW